MRRLRWVLASLLVGAALGLALAAWADDPRSPAAWEAVP